jgi:hypothetical protein
MMHRDYKRATKAEAERITLIMSMHCVICALAGDFRPRKLECHHIVRANKRMGHLYTLPCCVGHHRGVWTDQIIQVGITDGRHAFKEQYGYDELELWQRLQITLGLDDSLPISKIVARKVA